MPSASAAPVRSLWRGRRPNESATILRNMGLQEPYCFQFSVLSSQKRPRIVYCFLYALKTDYWPLITFVVRRSPGLSSHEPHSTAESPLRLAFAAKKNIQNPPPPPPIPPPPGGVIDRHFLP